MRQYLLSVHHAGDYPAPEPEVVQRVFAQVDRFNQELQDSGAWVFAGGLQPRQTARTVRFEDGRTAVTDGPWSQAEEQLGGFWVVQAEDLDAALQIADRAARACEGDVEVRPFQGE